MLLILINNAKQGIALPTSIATLQRVQLKKTGGMSHADAQITVYTHGNASIFPTRFTIVAIMRHQCLLD
jgi:hypothetical protein